MTGAIILAAGQARRMGRNKMLLPFGGSTVIVTVVSEVAVCEGVHDIVVVVGDQHEQVTRLLSKFPVRCVFNPAYAQAEMLVSIQVGLRALNDDITAGLIVLGDQPRIQHDVVERVIAAHSTGSLVIPSFRGKRGHPILIDRLLWPEILALPPEAILHDFIRAHEAEICYVEADNDSVIRDMDTPEDYDDLIHRKGAEDAES